MGPVRRTIFMKRFLLFLLLLLSCPVLFSQSPQPDTQSSAPARGRLYGTVSDPDDAVIPEATITLRAAGNHSAVITAVTDGQGRYTLPSLAPGAYTLTAERKGFASFTNDKVVLAAGANLHLNIHLKIATEDQQVEVSDQADTLDPNNNAGGLTLKQKDVDLLPDDPTLLQQQLEAMSGSTQNQIYVDGFSGGTLPPKNMIREIRINQNPYSAKNDTDPIMGMIEIFTKPGTDTMHGSFYASGNSSGLNAPNPFYPNQPSYYNYNWDGTLSGPINKRSSYFIEANRYLSATNQLIAAETLDSNFNQVPVNQALPQTRSSIGFNPRYDLQAGKSTLSIRYTFYRSTQNNGGTGSFSLASQGFDSDTLYQGFQISNSQNFGNRIINDTRFQYTRSRASQNPYSTAPSLFVSGAFNGGGSPSGRSQNNTDRYELQNYLSFSIGKHFLNVGARLRSLRNAVNSGANFSGQYTFFSLDAYRITLEGIQNHLTPQQIRESGGGASQFSLTAGTPSVAVNMTDVGFFYQDDWRLKPTLTLSYGIRYELQNHISDHADIGPRFGFAWRVGPKKSPFTLGGGTGFFYHRFPATSILNAIRQNGTTQQQYVINSPDFYPNIPPPASLGTQVTPTIYQISPNYRAQDVYVADIDISHSLTSHGRVSLNYWYARGMHDPLIRNVNAPLPGTYNPADPTSGVRPYGGTRNIYQYDSGGLSHYYRLMPNVSYFNKGFSIFASYQLVWDTANTDQGAFAANGYNINLDKGPAWLDIRHTLYAGGGVPLPFHFSTNFYLQARSAPPFNITVGQDLNGDSQFNDRPTFATDLTRPSVVATKWGTFDTAPIPGQQVIPYNYGRAPGSFINYLQLNRVWSFGPEQHVPRPPGTKGPLPRKYSLSFNVSVFNVFNHPSLAPPSGILSSPIFGRSVNTSGSSRSINLQTRFFF